jgi:TolB-like protein/Tfp pilus assembly protein PilF
LAEAIRNKVKAALSRSASKMKRCPQCNRVETDDALVFCRADGTALVSDFASPGGEQGSARIRTSSADIDEIETSILPHTSTTPNIDRPTAPTTVLPAQQVPGTKHALGKANRRKLIVVTTVVCALGLAAIIIVLVGSVFLYRSRTSTTAINSIAVMPFVNESGNADTEYLSDGMTETLISSLSQLPNLNVKARSSVFRYKGKETDAKIIGKELNVQAILNGRVVQRGEQMTLSLELVDVSTENVLWSQQYNRKQTDLVTLQSDIARDVSSKLKSKLSGADVAKVEKNYTANPEAYQLYLKGRFHWNKRTGQDLKKAVEYFNQAIAVDPNYALGYAGLADVYALLPVYTEIMPREAMPKAKEAALKALSLEAQLADAHASLGFIMLSYEYDFAGAEREYLRAIELNPNYAMAHNYYGNFLSSLGRHEQGIAVYKRTLEIEPLSLVFNRGYGERLAIARRYDEAIAQLKKTLDLDAGFVSARYSLAAVYQMKGDYGTCVDELAKYQELVGQPRTAALMRESYANDGWRGFLRMVIDKRLRFESPLHNLAVFYAALGEKDKAFAELNQAYENRDNLILRLKVDPRLDPLRDDPRFQELLRKVGFPQ